MIVDYFSTLQPQEPPPATSLSWFFGNFATVCFLTVSLGWLFFFIVFVFRIWSVQAQAVLSTPRLTTVVGRAYQQSQQSLSAAEPVPASLSEGHVKQSLSGRACPKVMLAAAEVQSLSEGHVK